MNSDGTDDRPLTSGQYDAAPEFSPDGSRIVFSSDRSGTDDIYSMAADGTDVRRLTVNPAAEMAPTFSPDGSRIAFSSRRSGRTDDDIYTVAADGSGIKRLATGPDDDSGAAFSPDGQ